MKLKSCGFTWSAAVMLALTPMLDASISGVVREMAIDGVNVVTAIQSTQGEILLNVSGDGGVTWSTSTPLLPSQGAFPVVAVGNQVAACSFMALGGIIFVPYNLVAGGTIGTPPNSQWILEQYASYSQEAIASPQGLAFVGPADNELLIFNNQIDFQETSLPAILFLSNTLVPPLPISQTLPTVESSTNIHSNPGAFIPGPAFVLAANGLTALGIAPQSQEGSLAPVSQVYQAGATSSNPWTLGPSASMPSDTKRGPLQLASQYNLVTSDNLSQAYLVWLDPQGNLHTSQLQPITSTLWTDPSTLSSNPLSAMGGVNFDESADVLQTICSTRKGHLIQATGSSSGIVNATQLSGLGGAANQISSSQIEGATGLWLVLNNNHELSLWQASPQGVTSMQIANNLNAVTDHNISMALASDAGTGVVLLMFDVTSPDANIVQGGLTGPGTYVLRSVGYPLDFTAQRINN